MAGAGDGLNAFSLLGRSLARGLLALGQGLGFKGLGVRAETV